MNQKNDKSISAPKNGVVIVAAGRGERIAGDGNGPKQYREIGEHAIIHHTLNAFANHTMIDLIQPVIHADDLALYNEKTLSHPKILPPVIGGATRQASCAAGVLALAPHTPENVLIHDAARPFVSENTISAVLDGIKPGIGALPVHAIVDTVKRVENGNVVETVSRENLFCAQTPQGFVWGEIANAHEKAIAAEKNHFTDDAAVGEWAGLQIKAIEVTPDNMKITTPSDLFEAKQQMSARSQRTSIMNDIRTGSGYDVHQTCNGDHVWLCGVKIAHNKGLKGHSDADVGLHSLTDALLGTMGAGDIGDHFPPSDPKWKGAASDQFLQHAVKLIRDNGGQITNMDVTIVCESPKIGPHRTAMRERIAQICEIDLERVSVKATTNEKIGTIGREEGICALATATVFYS